LHNHQEESWASSAFSFFCVKKSKAFSFAIVSNPHYVFFFEYVFVSFIRFGTLQLGIILLTLCWSFKVFLQVCFFVSLICWKFVYWVDVQTADCVAKIKNLPRFLRKKIRQESVWKIRSNSGYKNRSNLKSKNPSAFWLRNVSAIEKSVKILVKRSAKILVKKIRQYSD